MQILKNILFLFITIIVVIPCNGQNKNLEKQISKIDALLYSHRGSTALPLIDSLLEKKLPLSENLSLKASKIQALVQIDKYESALILSNEIIKNPNLKGVPLIKTYLETALLYEISMEFEESKKKLDFVDNYYKNANVIKDELYGEYLYRLSSWYNVQLLDKKASKYADMARVFGNKHNFRNVEATALMILASSRLNNNEAKVFSEKNKDYYTRALKLWENNYFHMNLSYSFLSDYYRVRKDYDKALTYIDSAIVSAKKVKFYYGLRNNLCSKSRLYEYQGNNKKALAYLKESLNVQDSVLILERSLKVSEISAKYNFEKETLKREILEQNLTIQKKEKNYLLIGFSILLVLLCSLVYLVFRNAKKRKEIKNQSVIINTKNLALTNTLTQNKLLLKELNHRVKNNLALILSLVKFQYYEIDEPIYKEKIQSLEHRIKTIATAHEQLFYDKEHLNDDNYDVQEYLLKITNALIDISTKKINLNLEAKNINLNIDTLLPVGILINELMYNSVKHAKSKNNLIIDIIITLHKNNINITYKDSGTEFIEATNKKSIGISIINSMVKQLKGSISRKDSEYSIVLRLKNSKKE